MYSFKSFVTKRSDQSWRELLKRSYKRERNRREKMKKGTMKTLLMITALTTLYSGKVFAEDFQFQQIKMSGTGCPEGTTSVIHSPDNKEVSILFDEFIAEVPQYNGDNDNDDSDDGNTPGSRFDERRSHKLCKIDIAAKIPEGHKVKGVEISVDFRGATMVEAGSIAMFRSVLMDWRGLRGRGSGKNVVANKMWNRPIDENWTVSETKYIQTNTSCSARNADQTLNLSMRNVISAILGRRVSPENTSAFIMMDSADLAGKLKVKLITERCGSSNGGGNGHGNGNGNGNGNGHGNGHGNGNGHGPGHGNGGYNPNPRACQPGWEFHPRLRRCVRAYSHLVGRNPRGNGRGW
ncbi:MAG: DUF4360 domain-containing protein [Deltaproteobacteria bacterium]|nr:MAG: DUF4360 domain-containing protein [Deltaproteobacteria bacterium]